MVVLALTNLIAAISLAGTSSLAILLKGSTITLPVPSSLDLLKSVLALMRSCSHLGSGFGLVCGGTTIGSGFGSGALEAGDDGVGSGAGAPFAAACAGASVELVGGGMIG